VFSPLILCQIHISHAVARINIEPGSRSKQNQLTTTNNQFKLEETLMQKVFESSGYQFTIITPNGGEPHFIAREVSGSLGYKKSSGVVQYFRDHNLATLSITKGMAYLSLK